MIWKAKLTPPNKTEIGNDSEHSNLLPQEKKDVPGGSWVLDFLGLILFESVCVFRGGGGLFFVF